MLTPQFVARIPAWNLAFAARSGQFEMASKRLITLEFYDIQPTFRASPVGIPIALEHQSLRKKNPYKKLSRYTQVVNGTGKKTEDCKAARAEGIADQITIKTRQPERADGAGQQSFRSNDTGW